MAHSSSLFKAVPRNLTLSERAHQQLSGLILDLSLQPGDRLPSQDELSRRLGVSRTVVREAVQSLVARGLLESRKGSGLYVRQLGPEMLKGPVNLLARFNLIGHDAITEARELLEPKIAELAALHSNDEDIEFLDGTLRQMGARRLTPSEYASIDLSFHNRLARSAGNPLLLAMAISINDVLINLYNRATNLYGTAWICDRARHHHARILVQVKARNAAGARLAMEEHMAFSREVLEQIESPANGTAALERE